MKYFPTMTTSIYICLRLQPDFHSILISLYLLLGTDAPPAKRQKKNQEKSSCPFYKSNLISQLRDQSLLEVQDIEQMVARGRKMGACPYYAR